MPTPFPGMDPYLERRDHWHAVHTRLLVAIADALGPQVWPHYRVDIELRTYIALLTSESLAGIPDVSLPPPSGDLLAACKAAQLALCGGWGWLPVARGGRWRGAGRLRRGGRVKSGFVCPILADAVTLRIHQCSIANSIPGTSVSLKPGASSNVCGAISRWARMCVICATSLARILRLPPQHPLSTLASSCWTT